MHCSICNKELDSHGIVILNLRLCETCEQKILNISAERPEYDWYVSYVRRSLVEPLLQDGIDIIDIDEYRQIRKISR